MNNRNSPGPASDVLVIGGGAAGLFCAGRAARAGRSVRLLEGNAAPGEKIRISGGGRCNFTNLDVSAANFLSANPHFAKSALARFTPADFVALVERYGIAYHEKKLGQLFCDGSSRQIIEMLLAECALGGVALECHCRVESVTRGSRFRVETTRGIYEAEAVVVASGGLSIPALGVTDVGYRIARHFGHRIVEPLPALVPLTLDPREYRSLLAISGVSLPVVCETDGVSFRDDLLITHRGLSGPAVLQASSYWTPGGGLEIDLLPSAPGESPLTGGGMKLIANHLASALPRRLCAEYLGPGPLAPYERIPVERLSARDRASVAGILHDWRVTPSGSEGFKKAEVTKGGVSTEKVSSKTMESQLQPGLFFAGEVLDVTGWLGGYNFQWAWASAAAAARALSGG